MRPKKQNLTAVVVRLYRHCLPSLNDGRPLVPVVVVAVVAAVRGWVRVAAVSGAVEEAKLHTGLSVGGAQGR